VDVIFSNKLLLLGIVLLGCAASTAGQSLDAVLTISPGAGGGESFPAGLGAAAVLGPPDGQLWSLGWCGQITVAMTVFRVIDGPGPDFIVFENAAELGGNLFTEAAVVEVSQDGATWHRFPTGYDPGCGTGAGCYANLAGTHAVGDLSDAFGDPFDLADIPLAWCQFFRLTDCGLLEHPSRPETVCPQFDDDGNFINDTGNDVFVCGPANCGHDLDAIIGLHTEPAIPEPSPTPLPTEFALKIDVFPADVRPHDLFDVSATVINDARGRVLQFFVALEACGSFFFWPGWSASPDSQLLTLATNEQREIPIMLFTWPADAGAGSAAFWAACLDVNGILLGSLANAPFTFGQ